MVRKCLKCDSKFVVFGHLREYCSKECRFEATAFRRQCLFCGILFLTKIKDQVYCSNKCSVKNTYLRKRAGFGSVVKQRVEYAESLKN
jgi:hypothetical protein